jgi:hypothetical protein
MTRHRSIALAGVFCTLLAAPVVAAGDDDDPTGNPAIPPGEEQLVATMLGRGMGLQYCTLVRGGVEYSVIKATYSCISGEVTLELRHPRYATVTSTQTGKFAIAIQSGSPPPGFQDTLASFVRSGERDFEWSWPEHDAAAEDDDAAE